MLEPKATALEEVWSNFLDDLDTLLKQPALHVCAFERLPHAAACNGPLYPCAVSALPNALSSSVTLPSVARGPMIPMRKILPAKGPKPPWISMP